MSKIVRIDIESEGETNGFFTIRYDDGSVRKGWSCDQGSIEMDDEGELSDEESKACFDAWFSMPLDDDDFTSRAFAHWTPEGGMSAVTWEDV